ncbi:MAG: insulinase family protein [Methylococcales bacterium]|nr:insulinase family protein [Methylococcales bacterium]
MIFRIILFTLICLPISAYSSSIKVHERILKNGLKVLVKEDHRSPVVVSQVWYKVGSSYEPNGITGVSHMLEHMMFKGTEKYPIGEFSRIIAENGGNENAFTGRDYTAYFQTMEKSRLEVSFKLEADRMRNLRLDPKELKKELEVVTEERRMRTDDKPRSKTQEYFMAMAFTNSPYKNPVIGWPSDIANYQVEDLQQWYERWYAPNNATLVVAGDVKHNKVFALAEKYFSELKTSKIKQIKPRAELEQLGVRKTTIKLPAKLPYILMGYKVPVLNTIEDESEAYALEVLAGILDGGSSARLASKLVRGSQIAVAAGAGYNMISRLPDLFMLDATPAEGKTVFDMEYALKEEINVLKRELVSDNELQRVKAQVLASAVYEKDSNFYQAMQLGMLETIGMGWKKADEYVDKVNQITAEQIRKVARKYLLEENLNIAYLEPQPITKQKRTNKVAGGRHAN